MVVLREFVYCKLQVHAPYHLYFFVVVPYFFSILPPYFLSILFSPHSFLLTVVVEINFFSGVKKSHSCSIVGQ